MVTSYELTKLKAQCKTRSAAGEIIIRLMVTGRMYFSPVEVQFLTVQLPVLEDTTVTVPLRWRWMLDIGRALTKGLARTRTLPAGGSSMWSIEMESFVFLLRSCGGPVYGALLSR